MAMRPFAALALILMLAGPAGAVIVLDTGTPDETGASGVYYDVTFQSARFVAQEFTLVEAIQLSGVSIYAGGFDTNAIRVELSTAIGAGATGGDVLGAVELALPGTPYFGTTGEWLFGALDLALAAGSYYLVLSPANGSNPILGSSYLPIDAPAVLGDRWAAGDGMLPFTNVDLTTPVASAFALDNGFQPGVRIHAAPEPAAGLLLGLGALALARRRLGRRG